MGTLYDLLGALPGDDAEGLRKAFRKAAKATHPDTNPENPEAAVRFRELVRAYDILSDAEQRTTYDQLLTIALQPASPPPATARVYEGLRKFASSTMAATAISAVLVGGYALFGMFSDPPVAAEIARDPAAGTPMAGDVVSTAATLPATRNVSVFDLAEPIPAFATYNLESRPGHRVAIAYLDRDAVLYQTGETDRRFDHAPPVRRMTESKLPRASAPPRPVPVPLPRRRMPVTAALTP